MTAPPAAFPTIPLACVWHVGDLDRTKKRRGSYEGSGLSVSLHPSAWRMIGEGLVTGATWELRRIGGAFLDALELGEDSRSEFAEWGVASGYAEERPLWTWRYWDDDLDREVSQTFTSEEEARIESAEADEPVLERMIGHVSTPKLDAETMQDRETVGTRNVVDLLLPIYVERHTGLDGVWWSEELAPLTYSAPRGVIVRGRLPAWKRKQCRWDPDHSDHY